MTLTRIAVLVSIAVFIGALPACKQRRPRPDAHLRAVSGGATPGEFGIHFRGCPNHKSIRQDMEELISTQNLTDKVAISGGPEDLAFQIPERNTLDIEANTQKWGAPADRVAFDWK